MINEFTFGKTPAAIYLADRLNALNNSKLTRKISTMIRDLQNIVNEIEKSNSVGFLSAHVIGFMIDPLRDRIKASRANIEKIDQLSANLMANVMCGSVKDVAYRVMEVRHIEQQDVRNNPTGKSFVILKNIHRAITPELLIKRSKDKLEHRGKRITLY